MYTRARIAGHPIHPMLIAFPVALYVSTLVALIAHVATNDPFWYRVAMWTNVGGVAMAALAAIPGLIDLLSLPQHSRARATGLRHAGFNVLSLTLFAISAVILYRNAAYHQDLPAGTYQLNVAAPLVLSVLGTLSTVAAGWLGWTLVQTHHVGVKPEQPLVRPPDDVDDLGAAERDTAWPAGYRETYRTTIRH